MSKIQNRRYAAIRNAVSYFLVDGVGNLRPGVTRTQIVCELNLLADIGRSPKWIAAVVRWMDMVNDESHDARWALIEGSTGATYAA